ncbi:restriction endonuclease [Mycobacterium sp. MS1601]|uniref:restriction endonuclease n=1 Tax=Mycobacterium sp. MS1601 TaxID=1936029 RepID=UPI00178CF73F|nr:restriction endonuclease [Mycobacterium sp. MS1601]
MERFVNELSTMNAPDAERRLLPLLNPIMAAQGFDVAQQLGPDGGFDYVGTAAPDSAQQGRIGVEYKHLRQPVGVRETDRIIGLAARSDVGRIVLISRSGFTRSAAERALQNPVAVELLAPDDLLALARSIATAAAEPGPQIAALIRGVSEEMAKLVAQNPDALNYLEWRDLERMVTVVLDGLGFEAELTPASKDGGKDIILTLNTESSPRTYIVELKHWRSGKKVGENCVRDFVKVVAREHRQGGLFLSTHGFTKGAFESLTEIERTAVRFGESKMVANLCRSFVRVGAGLWSPDDQGLADLLFSDSINV